MSPVDRVGGPSCSARTADILTRASAACTQWRALLVAVADERRQGLYDSSATDPLQVLHKSLRPPNRCVEVVSLAAHCVNQTR
jgi:hypothetical protein